MKKHVLSVVLATGLAVTSGGWAVSNDANQELLKVVETKDKSIKVKSTKIANLETVIVEKDNDLKANGLVIDKQKTQINKQKKKNNSLKGKNETLKNKNETLKEKNQRLEKELAEANFKKKQKGSDVVGKNLNNKNKNSKARTISTSGESIGSFKMTSYVAMCSEGCTGVTATGIDIRGITSYQGHHIIATDPNVIPLWSIVKITTNSGSFTAISLDTGGKIDGRKIDYLVSSESQARQNGVQDISIEIMRRGK